MLLKKGSYSFEANTSLIGVRVQTMHNEGGQAYAEKHSWEVQGVLTADGAAALTTKMNLLKAALLVQGESLIFYSDDAGTTATATQLTNAGSITNVRITSGPDFARTEGPEYATERMFTFTAEAEYALTTSRAALLSFTETITFSGGGPMFAVVPCLDGPPVRFRIYNQTPFRATQRGQATGFLEYPAPMAAIWPFALKQAGEITRTAPKRNGRLYTGHATSWSYEYEAVGPLAGLPNIWRV